MSRLQTMGRFKEPDEKEPEVYSNCWFCGEDLVGGQEIEVIEQYYFCDFDCLLESRKTITLGER